MPGVDVLTGTISGPTPRISAPGATYFPVGLAERGPTTEARLVRSLAEFEYHYGGRVSYGALHDDLRTFFSEGGSRAYIGRIVGPAAVLATLTLEDRAGAPVNTLRIDADSAGTWANALTVEVRDAVSGLANAFDVVIAGTPDGNTEVFADLTSPAQAAAEISAGSRWVNAVDLGSVTAAPNNNPAVLAPASLANGADDRAALTGQDYVDAADDLFGEGLGAGAVAAPGQPSSAVGAGLMAHAQARNRLALLSTGPGVTTTAARAAAAALVGQPGDEHAGLFYPWVRIPAAGGTSRTISPVGYVAAVRARAHSSEGPWRAPAGLIAEARFLLGVERELTRIEGDELDAAQVSAIRTIQGGRRLYGWRSLSDDEDNYALLTGRDVLNDLVVGGKQDFEDLLFRSIDSKGHLFAEAAALLVGRAEPMRSAGGLFERRDPESGELLDKGYAVDTGPAVNTLDSIARNELRATMAVRVSPTGTLIVVTISKAATTAALA